MKNTANCQFTIMKIMHTYMSKWYKLNIYFFIMNEHVKVSKSSVDSVPLLAVSHCVGHFDPIAESVFSYVIFQWLPLAFIVLLDIIDHEKVSKEHQK